MNTAFEMFDDSAFAEMARVAQSIERLNTAIKFDDNTSAKLALAARSMERISTQIGETIPKDFSKRLSSHLQGIDFKNTIQWPEGMSDHIANSLVIPNPPALTSLSDSLADTAERMRRTFSAPVLVRQEPHIIKPSSKDIQAVVVESLPRPPVRIRGNTRYHQLHFERAKEIFWSGFRMGHFEIAGDIIEERGWTRSRNDAIRLNKVLGNSEYAAKHALAGQIKAWIESGWIDPMKS
jgi:hypothetical protein